LNIWQVLEIQPTTDLHEIKRAYALKLKKCKPEVDPEGFKLLRQAYEIAQKHAAGIEVNCEIQGESTQETRSSQSEYTRQDSVQAADHLLNVLADNEQDALAVFEEYEQKGWLDNLEFAEHFQQYLAINLLTAPAQYHGFIAYLIHYFDWERTIQNKSLDTYYRIAMTNLINQTKPYRFMRDMYFLAEIKNKKEAKKQDVNWLLCKAAKILLKPVRPFKFFCITFFCREQTQKILSIVDTVEKAYPEAIGKGFNLSSFNWWHGYKTKGFGIGLIFRKMFIFLLLFVNTLAFMDWFESVEVPSYETSIKQHEPSSVKSNIPYKVTFELDIDNPRQAIDINSDAISSSLANSNKVSAERGAVVNAVEKHDISIRKIIDDAFIKQLIELKQSDLHQVTLQVKLEKIGFMKKKAGELDYLPMLVFKVTAHLDNRIMWKDQVISYDPADYLKVGYSMISQPEYIRSAWALAAEDTVKKVLDTLQTDVALGASDFEVS